MNLSGLIGKVSGAFEEFHVVLDEWHVPRTQNGTSLSLQDRAMMLLEGIDQIEGPGLKDLLRIHFAPIIGNNRNRLR